MNASEHLHAWWLPAASKSDTAILMFHGNGYVLEEMVGDEVSRLRDIGSNLLLIDYRGYGSSTPITPNEATLNQDADAALNYLSRDRRFPMNRIFVLGRSIGSGPASHLAQENPGLAGLILESPFSSIDDAAATSPLFRMYPLGVMLRTHFDNVSRIDSVRPPLLIVTGTIDTLTPPWMAEKRMAEKILARARPPQQLYLVPGAGHNDLLEKGGDGLTQVIQDFVDALPHL